MVESCAPLTQFNCSFAPQDVSNESNLENSDDDDEPMTVVDNTAVLKRKLLESRQDNKTLEKQVHQQRTQMEDKEREHVEAFASMTSAGARSKSGKAAKVMDMLYSKCASQMFVLACCLTQHPLRRATNIGKQKEASE